MRETVSCAVSATQTDPPASAPYLHGPVSHEPRIQQLSDDFARLGLSPFHVPLGVMLNERDRHTSRCIRCDTCDGHPCLVSAKADAQVVCVDPALAYPNATLLTGAHVRRLETSRGGVFVPDRNHIHQRLLAMGIDHGRAVLILYAAAMVMAAGAFVSIFLNAREAALMVAALLFAGLIGIQRLGYDEFAFIRRGTVLRVYELPAVKRGVFIVFVDLGLTFAAAYAAIGHPSSGRSRWRCER